MRSGKRAKHAQGFVYIALLIGLAIVGIGLGATSEVWTQSRQREREEELLFIGNQFRQAITRFYQQSPPAARRFPLALEELIDDVRSPDKPAHHLRKLYADPMTGDNKWGEVRLAGGQLVGVYSLSSGTPYKVFGFALRDKDFVDKDRYSDWVFRSALPAANPVLAAGAGYASPGMGPATPPGGAPGRTPTPAPAPLSRPNAPTLPGIVQPTPRTR
jgi:type II secretory pathway pseudopilin PulG